MGKYEHRKSEKGKKKRYILIILVPLSAGSALPPAVGWKRRANLAFWIYQHRPISAAKKKEKSMAKKKDTCAVVPVQMYANLNGQTCAYTQGKVDNEGQLNQRRLPLQYSLGRLEANVHCVACAILVVCYRHFRFMGVLGWVAT